MPRALTDTVETKHADAAIEIKADGDKPGRFSALAAVFGNIDSHGDVMVKGAFERTLKERGYPKLVWSHDRYVPPIGVIENAEETDAGLLVEGRFFVADDEPHEIARQVYTAMKAVGGDGKPGLADFSFGCRVKAARWTEVDPDTLEPELQWTGGQIREITDVTLWEVGPCLVGANQQAGLLSLKSLADELGVTPADLRKALGDVRGEQPAKTDAPTPSSDRKPDADGVWTDRKHATRVAQLLAARPTTHPSED
ncbi:HK97 family phage prohead protease [Patulibacter brassicae]|uniref:HK97 family phage prohead protease n=1 Tax=Patulibacter brassicae TaxID=1705717 RepID=A0ABU4VJL9_9ACTN|nr:HK97 family phage prohead protease [Patulibacter brassicae]MDX8151098.1 HK97 family phage prohead protease [Patulibacter brassicae]